MVNCLTISGPDHPPARNLDDLLARADGGGGLGTGSRHQALGAQRVVDRQEG